MNSEDSIFTGKSLLVVEDDPGLRETLIMEFEMQGSHVFSASGGREAFEIINREKIDGVISDIRMGDGDGIELLGKIKEVNYKVPVLMFITGFSDLSIPDAYHLGAEAILKKPFDLDDLTITVTKMLLPKVIRWKPPADCDHQANRIERTFDSLESASNSGDLRLGRGGVFIQMSEKFPPRNRLVGLGLNFSSGPVHRIDGCGTLRWIRSAPQGELRAGAGMEFEHMTAEAALAIQALMDTQKVKSFIPRA